MRRVYTYKSSYQLISHISLKHQQGKIDICNLKKNQKHLFQTMFQALHVVSTTFVF